MAYWQNFRPLALISRKLHSGQMQLRYLLGDDSPAHSFLRQFRQTATQTPVPGQLGQLRGHGSQTVVVDMNFSPDTGCHSVWASGALVLKFERIPGIIPEQRLADERKNELLARQYLNRFMPPTLRVIGHGIENKPSALTYQQRIEGKRLRDISWRNICNNDELAKEVINFCQSVETMSRETGKIPDLAGTLPHADFLSNLFWRSRNILVDLDAGRIWLVDTGWKAGEERLREGSWRGRLRTRFRLYTMRLFHWWILRRLAR